ncbi:MAG TPA: SH3 domain-containing protein [Turneriella sp.]|nr:SH3 domain-containing protein [Turneriella sp.]HNA80413.1 SH3 domain-containing protein [Turneriella sp.]HNL11854.1 SH3 domain-containing protein [Turneriella sp.]HNL54657.1 SH3 domain-containing protein [Turneriella sp.]
MYHVQLRQALPKFFLMLLIANGGALLAQSKKVFVATSAGLNLREAPETTAKKLLTIPYGAQIQIEPTDQKITLEGIEGSWIKTSFKGKTGYAADVYLVSLPLPAARVSSLWNYLAQIAPGKDIGGNDAVRLATEFGITQSRGEGAGCIDGSRIIFSKNSRAEVLALTRIIYLKRFPALKKSYADFTGKAASAAARNSNGEKGIQQIQVYEDAGKVHFTDTFEYKPCTP